MSASSSVFTPADEWPGGNTPDPCTRFSEIGEILIFTMHDNEMLVQGLLKAGARGYLLKADAKSAPDRGRRVARQSPPVLHQEGLQRPIPRRTLTRPERTVSAITSRERSVVQLIAEGHTNKEVAKLLNISLKTVETHRATIMRKLQIASSAGLVRFAIRNKIVEA